MSREIKFRAWNKEKKEMFYSNIKDNVFVLNNNGQWDLGEADYEWEVNGTNEDNGILMQFTGLKDKNGKEIYEGDIVKIKGSNDKWEVVWVYGVLELQIIEGKRTRQRIGWTLPGREDECKVIGNIYENPELV